MLLLVDIGNTRLKAASVGAAGLARRAAVPTATPEAWAAWAATVDGPTRVVVANVAGSRVADAFAALATAHWGLTPEFVRPDRAAHGMRTVYRDPARLGVDRWLAALAAWRAQGGPVVVIDMGTALTVDVVTATGCHLGGLIAPGLELMRTSLRHGTAQLDRAAVDAVAGFADNTEDAIALGCWSAVAGLLGETRRRLASAAGTAGAAWFLTGGAGGAVAHGPLAGHPDRTRLARARDRGGGTGMKWLVSVLVLATVLLAWPMRRRPGLRALATRETPLLGAGAVLSERAELPRPRDAPPPRETASGPKWSPA